jgi:hypothetical protein
MAGGGGTGFTKAAVDNLVEPHGEDFGDMSEDSSIEDDSGNVSGEGK